MLPLKTCKVSCFDLKEVKHTVEVSAGSVYEAVAQALRIFRDNNWVEDIGHGQTPIIVKVKCKTRYSTCRTVLDQIGAHGLNMVAWRWALQSSPTPAACRLRGFRA